MERLNKHWYKFTVILGLTCIAGATTSIAVMGYFALKMFGG